MIITKETKERFVKMLLARQIVVIQCNKSARNKTYNYKILGVSSEGKWDFTHTCAELSNYPVSGDVQNRSIRSLDCVAVIYDVLNELRKEGIYEDEDFNYYDLYNKIRDLLTTFYI